MSVSSNTVIPEYEVERVEQIEVLFRQAMKRAPAAREAWLRAACADDAELYREVTRRLANLDSAENDPWTETVAAQAPAEPRLAAGHHLGPYQIVSFLAAGGMGAVYLARDPRTGRDVAIKTSPDRLSERFSREIRAVAALNHPNICTLYDVGPNYLVMELVEGESPKGPLPVQTALAYARQIAIALEAAHAKGIVHCDLKPANIKIKADGIVKVLDFGLANLGDEASVTPPSSITTTTERPPQPDGITGTAAYMSPEQVRAKP
jgi:eukaryotic-like serine/threonine-protein kinase